MNSERMKIPLTVLFSTPYAFSENCGLETQSFFFKINPFEVQDLKRVGKNSFQVFVRMKREEALWPVRIFLIGAFKFYSAVDA